MLGTAKKQSTGKLATALSEFHVSLDDLSSIPYNVMQASIGSASCERNMQEFCVRIHRIVSSGGSYITWKLSYNWIHVAHTVLGITQGVGEGDSSEKLRAPMKKSARILLEGFFKLVSMFSTGKSFGTIQNECIELPIKGLQFATDFDAYRNSLKRYPTKSLHRDLMNLRKVHALCNNEEEKMFLVRNIRIVMSRVKEQGELEWKRSWKKRLSRFHSPRCPTTREVIHASKIHKLTNIDQVTHFGITISRNGDFTTNDGFCHNRLLKFYTGNTSLHYLMIARGVHQYIPDYTELYNSLNEVRERLRYVSSDMNTNQARVEEILGDESLKLLLLPTEIDFVSFVAFVGDIVGVVVEAYDNVNYYQRSKTLTCAWIELRDRLRTLAPQYRIARKRGICTATYFIVEQVFDFYLDTYNYNLFSIDTFVQNDAAAFERNHFDSLIEDGTIVLNQTRRWIIKLQDLRPIGMSNRDVIAEGVFDIISRFHQGGEGCVPETMELDIPRIDEASCMLHVTIVGVVISTCVTNYMKLLFPILIVDKLMTHVNEVIVKTPPIVEDCVYTLNQVFNKIITTYPMLMRDEPRPLKPLGPLLEALKWNLIRDVKSTSIAYSDVMVELTCIWKVLIKDPDGECVVSARAKMMEQTVRKTAGKISVWLKFHEEVYMPKYILMMAMYPTMAQNCTAVARRLDNE